ncbi:MAG: hypothetical protein QOJ20_3027 [Mycobacterium sp.]|nr:hypothetical protein [Mycobacterium sp.]
MPHPQGRRGGWQGSRSTTCEDLEFYLREVRFYQEIGLANPLRPARPYFAAFDETTHDFVLVLEDLGRLRLADQTERVHRAGRRDGDRRHCAAPRLLVGERPLRVDVVVEDNRASEVADGLIRAMQARDVDGAVGAYSDQLVYDDRRRLSGDPIEGRAGLRAATERIFEQYSLFEGRTLAVRGERVVLLWGRWSDDAGNETTYLHVFEIGDDGRIVYAGRFDEDDFEGAYRDLERRYYAGEGAACAEAGMAIADYAITKNRGDFDTLFGALSSPELRIKSRSRSVFVDRSAAEYRAILEELIGLVGSVREWLSAMCWVSPSWFVAHLDREAVGREGEQYEWTRLVVGEVRDGRLASVCDFDLEDEDEDAAFAYAEERVRAASRLAVTNRASESVEAGWLAMRAHDVDGLVAVYSDRFEYDDRRRLSGYPIESSAALRAAAERILEQYPDVEWRTLAVRGECLELHWSRWSDDAGNETTYLHVVEIGDDGRITYDGRFDEDDFEGAYREIDRRYYAGEGAAFAEAGATVTDYAIALNRSEFDRVFGELTGADFRLENRSRSGFGDRSAAELRATYEDLTAMVASARIWHSALCWLSPTLAVGRFQRDAVGRDGERYAWTLIDGGRDPRRAGRVDVPVRA